MKIILVLLSLIVRLIVLPQAAPVSTTEEGIDKFSKQQLNSIRKGRFVEINQTTFIENIDRDDGSGEDIGEEETVTLYEVQNFSKNKKIG